MKLSNYSEKTNLNDNDLLLVEDTTAGTQKMKYSTVKDKINSLIANSQEISDLKKSVSDGKKMVADAITGKGVSTAADATFQQMADNVNKIQTGGKLQSKSAALLTTAQTIKPDSGYDGLSQVTVPAVTGTAATADVFKGKTFNSANGVGISGTMENNGAVEVNYTPNSTGYTYKVPKGYHDGNGKVTISAVPTQSKIIAPSTSEQTITPDSGKYLSNVTVEAVIGNAAASNVLNGRVFNSATAGINAIGTMANKSNTTSDAAYSEDSSYMYLTIPSNGYYTTSSKLRAKLEDIINIKSFTAVSQDNRNNTATTECSVISEKNANYLIICVTRNGGTILHNITVNGDGITPKLQIPRPDDYSIQLSIAFYHAKNDGENILARTTGTSTNNASALSLILKIE